MSSSTLTQPRPPPNLGTGSLPGRRDTGLWGCKINLRDRYSVCIRDVIPSPSLPQTGAVIPDRPSGTSSHTLGYVIAGGWHIRAVRLADCCHRVTTLSQKGDRPRNKTSNLSVYELYSNILFCFRIKTTPIVRNFSLGCLNEGSAFILVYLQIPGGMRYTCRELHISELLGSRIELTDRSTE